MKVPMSAIFEELGFERFNHPLSSKPAFRQWFGPHEVQAVVLVNRWLQEGYVLSGIVNSGREISSIEGELPLEVESREEGVALISHFLAEHIPEALKLPWLRIGERMQFALPWKRTSSAEVLGSPERKNSKKMRDNLHKASHPNVSISLDVETNEEGAIELSGQDLGNAPAQCFGSDSYEYWVRLKPEALPHLAHALLVEKYRGAANAVSDFRDFCQRHGVPHEYGTWPL